MALISIVISLLIAAILIIAVLTFYRGGKNAEDDVITSPIKKGKAVQCLAQIRRVETVIQMHLAEYGRYPSSLSELKDLSDADFYCPVTNNSYYYNSSTGKVTCPDHPK